MNTLKEILPYYLGTGAKMQTCINIEGNPVIEELTIDYLKSMIDEPIGELPLLRTFDSLTKPITVEGYNGGKPFVPIDMLFNSFGIKIDEDNEMYLDYYEIGLTDSPFTGFRVIQLLLKWHFNIFGLPTDQFIEIKD